MPYECGMPYESGLKEEQERHGSGHVHQCKSTATPAPVRATDSDLITHSAYSYTDGSFV